MESTKREIARMYSIAIEMEESELEAYQYMVYDSSGTVRAKELIQNFFESVCQVRKKKGNH